MKKRKPGIAPDLYGPESFRLAMVAALLSWPGTSISDGAFAILQQVAEYQKQHGHD